MISTISSSSPPYLKEQRLVLPGHQTWQQFEMLDHLLTEEDSRVRLFYLDGITELMTLSPEHELIKSILEALLVTFFCKHQINAIPMGSATIQIQEKAVSIEPDLSYRLDGAIGAPQLAIEIALSSGGQEKLSRYKRLEIPEVWFWQNNRLWLYGWTQNDYQALQTSQLLTGIKIDQLEVAVRKGNLLEAIQSFTAASGK